MPAPKQQLNLAEWQDHLDFLLPRKEMLRADEIAAVLNADEKTVHRLFDSATLHGHDINAAGGERQHRRYRRDSAILFLAERANYTPEDLRLRLFGLIAKQPTRDLQLLHAALTELIRKRGA